MDEHAEAPILPLGDGGGAGPMGAQRAGDVLCTCRGSQGVPAQGKEGSGDGRANAVLHGVIPVMERHPLTSLNARTVKSVSTARRLGNPFL